MPIIATILSQFVVALCYFEISKGSKILINRSVFAPSFFDSFSAALYFSLAPS